MIETVMPKSRTWRVDFFEKELVGWRVEFSMNKFRVCRFFSDAVYGGNSAARAAAVEFAERESRHVAEFLSLTRRLQTRKNTPHGMPGICYVEETVERGAYWVAYWDNEHGRKIQRKFSVKIHGEDGARQLAIEFRRKGIAEYLQRYQLLIQTLKLDDIAAVNCSL